MPPSPPLLPPCALISLTALSSESRWEVRKGQSGTSWLDPCLPSTGDRVRKPVSDPAAASSSKNRLQTHPSAAADWPSLRCTKSPTRGWRCWVSVISRTGEICCSRERVRAVPMLSAAHHSVLTTLGVFADNQIYTYTSQIFFFSSSFVFFVASKHLMCYPACSAPCNRTLLKSAFASVTAAFEVENWFTCFHLDLVKQSQHILFGAM